MPARSFYSSSRRSPDSSGPARPSAAALPSACLLAWNPRKSRFRRARTVCNPTGSPGRDNRMSRANQSTTYRTDGSSSGVSLTDRIPSSQDSLSSGSDQRPRSGMNPNHMVDTGRRCRRLSRRYSAGPNIPQRRPVDPWPSRAPGRRLSGCGTRRRSSFFRRG